MARRLWTALLATTAIMFGDAHADGLIYQLPADGAWVKYKLEIWMKDKTGRETTMPGSVTIRSVGAVNLNGRDCRWIEIDFDVQDGPQPSDRFRLIHKLLIPERDLRCGSELQQCVKRYWFSDDIDPPIKVPIESGYLAEVGEFMQGPDSHAVEHEPIPIVTSRGNLICREISTVDPPEVVDGITREGKETVWLHPSVPFGVVASAGRTQITNRNRTDDSTTKLTLDDYGTDAKSALPNAR